MIQVIFLINQDELFEYFPNEHYHHPEHQQYNDVFTCYAHLGQHSGCHKDYAKEAKEANYNEYQDLLKELIWKGYKNLKVMNKQTIEAHREPTKAEIKFGEGATHWLTVALSETLNKKGDIKKWFINPYDGLRYYTN